MDDLRWAAPTRDDDEAWAGLLAAIEGFDGRGEAYELVDLADEWASVWSHPETDSVFVWSGDELVAFGWLKVQRGEREHHRIACWGGVHPSQRGRGIGRAVLAWQVQRASAVAVGLDPRLRTSLLLEALETQRDVAALAERAGFARVRRFLELARPVTGAPIAPPLADLEVRPFDQALDEGTRLAHAEAFADHWGSEPHPPEQWRQWHTTHRGFRPELSRVAVDGDGTVVAFVLCAAYPQDWHLVPRELWVTSVGTRRAWRGRGVARALLVDVLDAAAGEEDGFERAILGVDEENATGAVRLYRGLGFTEVHATLTYERGPLA